MLSLKRIRCLETVVTKTTATKGHISEVNISQKKIARVEIHVAVWKWLRLYFEGTSIADHVSRPLVCIITRKSVKE